ncbi:MAG: hypothetical protein ABW001_15325 [Mycobacterium sp.]
MVSPRTEPTFSRKLAAGFSLGVLATSLVVMLAPGARAGSPFAFTEYTLPVDGSSPFGITTGSDGALWFTERGADAVGSVDTDGSFSAPTSLAPASDPTAITAGPDGALWFTEQGAGLIGRVDPADGSLTEFGLPTDGAGPAGIVTGPDGALWFTERSAHRIGRLATDGTAMEFIVPTPVAGPLGIAVGSDGNLWFTEQRANQIGRITTNGEITEFPLPVTASLPSAITAGPDGALWFTMRAANRIGRIDTVGNVTTFAIPTAATDPTGITVGWDGALWFTEPDVDSIGRITTAGTITEHALPQVGSSPFGITAGPDDAVWFTEGNGNRIGRLGVSATPPDTLAPTIAITSPADGGVFLSGQSIAAGYGCSDETGGSGLATCAGPVANGQEIDLSAGSHTFTVTASDVAGNTSSASTDYLVFSDIGGSLLAPSTQRAGFWVTLDLGMESIPRDVSKVVAAGYPQSQQVSCADPSTALGPLESVESRLQVKQGGLDVRWRSERAWEGTCRALVLRFVAPGWTGVDAVFVTRFLSDSPGGRHK